MADEKDNQVRRSPGYPKTPSARPGLVRKAARWWLDGWVTVPRRALFGPETRAMAVDARQLAAQLRGDYHRWRQLHDRRLPELSYAQMLAAWGIEEEDVHQTRIALRRARWRIAAVGSFAYCALLAQLALDGFKSWGYLLIALGCVLALGVNMLALSWRLHCLRKREYQEFSAWLGARLPNFRRSVR
jgi:hypothetical protein